MAASPAPAEGFLPGVGESKFIAHTQEQALDNSELSTLKSKETRKLNLCQAVNEGLATAMSTDKKAGILYKRKFIKSHLW